MVVPFRDTLETCGVPECMGTLFCVCSDVGCVEIGLEHGVFSFGGFVVPSAYTKCGTDCAQIALGDTGFCSGWSIVGRLVRNPPRLDFFLNTILERNTSMRQESYRCNDEK